MRLAMVAAEFTPERSQWACAAPWRPSAMSAPSHTFETKFIGRMVARGYDSKFRAKPVSSRSRVLALTVFPKAMPPASRCWSMSRPGSRSIIPPPLPPPCSIPSPWAFMRPPRSCAVRASMERDGAAARCRVQRLGLHPGARRQRIDWPCGWACARSTASPKADARLVMEERGYGYRELRRFRPPHRLAETRPDHPGGSRCLSGLWPGPPRRPVGGAPSARRYAAALVCHELSRRHDRKWAAKTIAPLPRMAAKPGGGGRLPDLCACR